MSSSAQQELIIQILEQYPEGASLDEIAQCLRPRPSDRTVQRLVGVLIAGRRVESRGSGRDTRYRLMGSSLDPSSDNGGMEVGNGMPAPSADGGSGPEPSSGSARGESGATAGDAPSSAQDLDRAQVAAQPVDRDFPEMFDVAVPMIVFATLAGQALTFSLVNQALKNGKNGIVAQAYLAYAMRRLDALAFADVAGYGLTAGQFETWRVQFDGGK